MQTIYRNFTPFCMLSVFNLDYRVDNFNAEWRRCEAAATPKKSLKNRCLFGLLSSTILQRRSDATRRKFVEKSQKNHLRIFEEASQNRCKSLKKRQRIVEESIKNRWRSVASFYATTCCLALYWEWDNFTLFLVI